MRADGRIPLSVLIPTRNEEANLPRCLGALDGWAGEIIVVDSQSTDRTVAIAKAHGAEVLQFYYQAGWPKKRQWALDTYDFQHEWILLLDADEILSTPVKDEIRAVIEVTDRCGYWLRFRPHFMGVELRYGGFELWKLFLFRRGTARYEKRLLQQDRRMGDIEVHEHVMVDGPVGRLVNPIIHDNRKSLYSYIEKHNEYSEWEARSYEAGLQGELDPSPFGNQAQRRRWLKRRMLAFPGFPLATFLYHYILRLGFLHGRPGYIYCALKAVHAFQAKAKQYERRLRQKRGSSEGERNPPTR